MERSRFSTISEAVEQIKRGGVVIVLDDENRENEGDYVCAAELATQQREAMLRRARHHLSGTLRRLDELITTVAATPIPFDDQLTERHEGARIDPIP